MKICLNLAALGIPIPNDEPEALQLAGDLETGDFAHIVILLQDLTLGGCTIYLQPGQEMRLELRQKRADLMGHQETMLDLLGINAAPNLNGLAIQSTFIDVETLIAWTKEQPFVVDQANAVSTDKIDMLFADKEPQNPSAFKVIITLSWQEAVLIIACEGHEPKSIAMIGQKPQRFYADVAQALKQMATAETVKPTPSIVLPILTTASRTTLTNEIGYLHTMTEHRLHGYTPPEGDIPMSILQILLAHCDESTIVGRSERATLHNQIREAVRAKQPVPVSLSLAVGTRIANRLKFFENTALPTFGWLYAIWMFDLIHQKVQTIYEPGLRFVLFDEATLFANIVSGHTATDVAQHLQATRQFITLLGAPMDIIELTREMLPLADCKKVPVTVVEPATIYAMACSLPQMRDEASMAALYVNRDRDYGALRQQLGHIWDEAEQIAVQIHQALTLRKQVKLFPRLAEKLGIKTPLIDACVTEKKERLVLKLTGNTLFNHGMPMVMRDATGRLKVHIVPEYRIGKQYPHAQPIFLSPQEFGVRGADFTFYYLDKRR